MLLLHVSAGIPAWEAAMTNHPLTLTDQHRTLVLHVLEDHPGSYCWRIVVEECGGAAAECDSTIESPSAYPSHAEAEAACWAAGNRLLDGIRTAGEARAS